MSFFFRFGILNKVSVKWSYFERTAPPWGRFTTSSASNIHTNMTQERLNKHVKEVKTVKKIKQTWW